MAGKSLAELRADGRVRLLEWTHDLCLAQDLVAKVQTLAEEKKDIKIELAVDPDGDVGGENKKPRRANDPRQVRLREIEDELAATYAEMADHTGELVMRAIPAGEWRRWVEEHPARVEKRDEQNRPILNPLDEQYAGGYCNADALADALRKFAVSWNGEPVSDDDWKYLLENAASGDVKAMCQTVVARMELPGARAPKASSSGSSGTRSSAKR